MSEQNTTRSRQYLTFTLAGEVFGLDIAAVCEVLELTTITKVPRMPGYMRGVINLRGQGVPVIDLRRKFGLECAKDTVETCIIIVETEASEGRQVTGAIADSVREVLEIGSDEIMPAPRMGTAVRTDSIEGIARQGESFIIILKAGRIFSGDELEQANVPSVDMDDAEAKPAAPVVVQLKEEPGQGERVPLVLSLEDAIPWSKEVSPA